MVPPMFLYNHPDLKKRRQRLRKQSTPAERKLWGHLRAKRFRGIKFFRQFGIGPYVVDFYCPKARLAIEVDGDSHFRKGAKAYDLQRQRYIESFNVRVIRFLNSDIHENMDGVLQKIEVVIAG